MKIAHVALWTRDLEEQKAFWRHFFAAESNDLYISKNRPGFRSYFVSLAEGPTIELMSLDGLESGPHGKEVTGWAHLAITVGSRQRVDEMVRKADASNILVSPARVTGDGYYEAIIRDPDGNLIEIVS